MRRPVRTAFGAAIATFRTVTSVWPRVYAATPVRVTVVAVTAVNERSNVSPVPTVSDASGDRYGVAPLSYWRELTPAPSMVRADGRIAADVVVVGLGAAGLLAAKECAAAGARVIGIDAGQVGRGAAGANGGFLLSGGSRFLHDAIDTWGRSRAERLWHETCREFDREVEEFAGLPVGLRRCGSLRVAGHPFASSSSGWVPSDDEVDDLQAHERALVAVGVDVRRSEVGGAPALFVPGDGWIDPALRVNVLAAKAVGGGARLFENERVRSLQAGLVRTDRREIVCSFVLVCVDGHLEDLVPGLPVNTHRLEMLRTSTLSGGRLPLPTYMRFGFDYGIDLDPSTHGSGFVLGGFRDGHPTLSPASAFSGPAVPTKAVQHDLDALAAQIAGRPVEVTSRWAASVSFTEDGWPLVREVDRGVWVVGGLSGHGNLIGPMAARTIAVSITGSPAESSAARSVLAWLAG